MDISHLEGIWKGTDGGFYTISKVDNKLAIHGIKILYENHGIGEFDESSGKIKVEWKDSIVSNGNKKAKTLQTSFITVSDQDHLKSDGSNKDFPDYGTLTRL